MLGDCSHSQTLVGSITAALFVVAANSARLQDIHFGLVYFSPWGNLNQRRPHKQPSTGERREDQRCKEFSMHGALRAVQITH